MRFALDKHGRLVHVSKANPTDTYYCPLCGCPMQVSCESGVLYFEVSPGAAHAKTQCQTPRHRFSDLWMTSSEELKKDLLSRSGNDRINPIEKKDKRKDEDTLLHTEYTKTKYSVVPFRFLSDFRKEGIYNWPADTMLNGYRLTDLFISKKNADVLMHDNKPLGFRIVDVTFSRVIGANTLRFALYATTEGRRIRYFDLSIDDAEDYEILTYEVLTYKSARYYVAGIWESVDCTVNSIGDWSVIGIQKAKFTNTKQLYRYRCR